MSGYADTRKRAKEGNKTFGKTSIIIPSEFQTIKIEGTGRRMFDFLPYVAGDINGFADKGSLTDELSFYVHRSIGPDDSSYNCLNKTFKKKCPVCEHASALRRSGDKESLQLSKDLAPRRRQLYALRDKEETEAGIQIWEYSYHLFGKQLEERIANADDVDGYHTYFHLESGSTLRIGFVKKNMGSSDFFEASSIDFKPRGNVPKSMLDKVPCLDDFIVRMTYDELHAIYYQDGGSESATERGREKVKSKSGGDEDWGDGDGGKDKKKKDKDDEPAAKKKDDAEESPKSKKKDEDWDDEPARGKKKDDEPAASEASKGSSKSKKDEDWD